MRSSLPYGEGEFEIIWQAPEGYKGQIKQGDTGPVVNWLSNSLNRLSQSSAQPQSRFDRLLKNKLIDYQSKQGLRADGIAGVQTILRINAETLSGIPLLEPAI